VRGASGLERQCLADVGSLHRGGGGEAAAVPDDLVSPPHLVAVTPGAEVRVSRGAAVERGGGG